MDHFLLISVRQVFEGEKSKFSVAAPALPIKNSVICVSLQSKGCTHNSVANHMVSWHFSNESSGNLCVSMCDRLSSRHVFVAECLGLSPAQTFNTSTKISASSMIRRNAYVCNMVADPTDGSARVRFCSYTHAKHVHAYLSRTREKET